MDALAHFCTFLDKGQGRAQSTGNAENFAIWAPIGNSYRQKCAKDQ